LDRGSIPSGSDEDGPAIIPMATTVTGKDDRTCKTPKRWVVFVNTSAPLVLTGQKIPARDEVAMGSQSMAWFLPGDVLTGVCQL
jgi:hypothetical protein